MKRKYIILNVAILFVSLVSFMLVSCLIVSNVNKRNIKTEINNYLQIVVKAYDGDNMADASSLLTNSINDVRVTFIDTDGNVLYDTKKDEIEDNHLDRPELKNLGNVYFRYSNSLGKRMVYVAGFKDNVYIRVAILEASVVTIVNYLVGYGFLALFIISIISFVLMDNVSKKAVIPLKTEIKKISNIVGENVDNTSDDIEVLSMQIDEIHSLIDKKIFLLKSETAKLNYIVDNMAQGLVIINALNDVVLINSKALNILDINNLEIVGKPYLYLIRDIKLQEIIDEVINNDKNVTYNFESNGKHYLFSINSMKNSFASYDNKNGVSIFMVDITNEKKLERVKLDFFANASHELKSPLTSIIGYQQMIEEGIITDENEIKDATTKTIKEANRMNQIIIEMLELSKLEAKNNIEAKEVLSIKNTTLDILASLMPNMHQKHISYKIIGNDFNVFIAPTDLNHLIRNLIDNAIKYNKENGTITIELNDNTFSVSDTGIGISKENISRIFERFYRVDKAKSKELGGTGLGLAIVKHICMNNNLKIDVESALNEGSKFCVKF